MESMDVDLPPAAEAETSSTDDEAMPSDNNRGGNESSPELTLTQDTAAASRKRKHDGEHQVSNAQEDPSGSSHLRLF